MQDALALLGSMLASLQQTPCHVTSLLLFLWWKSSAACGMLIPGAARLCPNSGWLNAVSARSHDANGMQNGLLWGLPIVMDTDSEDIGVGDKVLLKYQGQDIATFEVSSKWRPNKPLEALKCYATSSIEHPAVQMISMEPGHYYLGEICNGVPTFQMLWHLLLRAFCSANALHGASTFYLKQDLE